MISIVAAGLFGFQLRSHWRDLQFLRSSAEGEIAELTPISGESHIPPEQSSVGSLSRLPTPRYVRLKSDSRMELWAYAVLGAVLFGWIAWGLLRATPLSWWVHGAWLVAIVLIVGIAYSRLHRDRDLVMNGEISIGKVTSQSFIRFKATMSKVNYEFQANDGRLFKAYFDDQSKQLFPGMEIIVFYDISKPKRHVPLEQSFYEPYDPLSGPE